MSENQQPLDEEQAVPDVQEQETLPQPKIPCPLRRTKMHPPSLTQNPKKKKKILILPM